MLRFAAGDVKELPDKATNVHIAQAAQAPSALSLMHLYPIDARWAACPTT